MSDVYDFDFIGEEEDEDPRINLHVTKCCGNCKWYTYEYHKPRRAYCGLNRKTWSIKRKRDWNDVFNNWPRVHFTCLCDKHEYRKGTNLYKSVKEWVGKGIRLWDASIDEL